MMQSTEENEKVVIDRILDEISMEEVNTVWHAIASVVLRHAPPSIDVKRGEWLGEYGDRVDETIRQHRFHRKIYPADQPIPAFSPGKEDEIEKFIVSQTTGIHPEQMARFLGTLTGAWILTVPERLARYIDFTLGKVDLFWPDPVVIDELYKLVHYNFFDGK